MIARFRRYADNHGPAATLINLGLMVWMGVLVVRTSSRPVGIIVLPMAAAVLLVTYLLSGPLARRAGATLRVLRTAQFVIIGFIIANVTNIIHPPPLVWLFMWMVTLAWLSVHFWVMSHPMVYSAQGFARDQDRQQRRALASLERAARAEDPKPTPFQHPPR